jgi:hypothetical protein
MLAGLEWLAATLDGKRSSGADDAPPRDERPRR